MWGLGHNREALMKAKLYHFWDHPDLIDEHGRHLGFIDYLMPPEQRILRFPDHYIEVAEFDLEGSIMGILETIFVQTNSVTTYWGNLAQEQNIKVYPNPHHPSGWHRSTSCGDVVRIDGQLCRCEPFGWKVI